jgi:uncharacterized protein (TIGR03437 family)
VPIGSKFLWLAVLAPSALFATSFGAPIGHAGVPSTNPIDNSVREAQTCVRCHTTYGLNPPGGYVKIEAFHYRPGETQTIKVTVSHPEARKWGFQLTARRTSDLNQRAGTFGLGGVRVRCSDIPVGRDLVPGEPTCPGDQLEFAGHNENLTTGGLNGTKTFNVEWKAPDTDVGNIVFYASGNASNEGLGNQGDRIYHTNFTIQPDPTTKPCPYTTRPTLTGARNAGSGTTDISVNSLVSIFGRDFGVSSAVREASTADFRNGYPKELNCIAVEIGGQRAPLTYVKADQINAQVPTLNLRGDTQMRVILNPDRPNQIVSDVATVSIRNHSPAFFTFANRTSVAAVHNSDGVNVGSPTAVQGARPAQPGDLIQLYATGLGFTDPVWQAGEMPTRPTRLMDQLTVTMGGTALAASDVLYAGAVPDAISGLFQINIRVPQTAGNGEVPITLSIGGVNSPAGTTITVAR